MQFDPRAFIAHLENGASDVFEILTDTFIGKADTLRDGSEFDPVVLPRDLAAHPGVQTEWWYYTGHFASESGRNYGFELVFFKRRTDLDKLAVVPLRLIGNPFYFAHFALTDKDSRTFRYSHRKSTNGPLDHPAVASETHFYLGLGDWTSRQSGAAHILRATLEDGTTLEATLSPLKPAVLNGENGVSFKDKGEASRYFSFTRMLLEGNLVSKEGSEFVRGSAWMDREFGTWAPTENQKGWDWFSIQLDNGCDLMCYQLRDSKGEVSSYSSGTFVDEHGSATHLSGRDFKIVPIGSWESPRSGAVYPSVWQISIPRLALDLRVEPVMADQELDTRGSTMIIYWEGSCKVEGTAAGSPVGGQAYVELVGYDRSHESPNLAYFLIGSPAEILSKFGFK